MDEIGVFEAINSQRQFTRYKTDPVPREALERIVDAATRAPSGANRQPWQFVIIIDPALISKVGELYRDVWLNAWGATTQPGESAAHTQARYLAEHMPEVPAMIMVCVERGAVSSEESGDAVRGREGSSIWLAVQNIFLAARALGLGTRLTTAHLRQEQAFKDLLGIPESLETVTLIPVGYPRGAFGPTRRRPVAEVTSYNRFGERFGERG